LIRGAVAHDDLTPLLDSGLALYLDAGGHFLSSGSVALEAVHGVHLLDYVGFLRIIRGLVRSRSFSVSGFGRCRSEGKDEREQGETVHRKGLPRRFYSKREAQTSESGRRGLLTRGRNGGRNRG